IQRMTIDSPSAEGLAWAQRLIRINSVSRETTRSHPEKRPPKRAFPTAQAQGLIESLRETATWLAMPCRAAWRYIQRA
ncbi:hypothetical protein, partial [Clostridium perfringens]